MSGVPMKVDSLENMEKGIEGFRGTGRKGKAPLHINAILKRLKKIKFNHEFLDTVRKASEKDWLYTEILNKNDPANKEEIKRDLIWYKHRLQIPNYEPLHLEIA